MSNARDRAQGVTKQVIGQMIGDQLLVQEGKAQEHAAEWPREAEARREPPRKRS
jgi:uncharacterized protein YjbJ (UPF0337 family)